MALKALTDDEKTELKEQFGVLDKDESGFINLSELKEALDLAGQCCDKDSLKILGVGCWILDPWFCSKPKRGFRFSRDYIVKLKHLIQSQDFFDIASFKIS